MNRRRFIKTGLLWLAAPPAIIAATPQQVLLLSKPPAAPAASVNPISSDVYVDMEDGADGDTITSTVADNCTHGTAGTWTLVGTTANTVSTSFENPLRTPVLCGGTTYQDLSGTRGWKFSGATHYAQYRIASVTHPIVVASCWMNFHGVNTTNNYDVLQLNSQSSAACTINWPDDNTNKRIRIENDYLGGAIGADIPIEYDTWYWVCVQFEMNGTSKLKVFNADGTVKGESTQIGQGNYNFRDLFVGMYNTHGATTAYVSVDDLVIDWTNHIYPLGP